MPTVTLPVPQTVIEHSRPNLRPVALTLYRTFILGALSTIVFFVHGYHPYSQDAGIYVAAIEKALNPSLFQADAAFVSNHAHFSIFSYTLAAIVRTFHIPLNDLLLGAYLSSVVLFLVACRCLAVRLFASEWDQWGALLLLSACYTLPVAGTSVLLMDPYVTARSFAIAFMCIALAFVGMAIADNQSYLESSRIEIPGMTETNPWTRAFLWIRLNTPQNAVFAAAPSELTVQDEDAQGFRAIAERSILDGVKDEGLASIFPGLAEDWFKYHNAEHGLNRISDTKRFSQLHGYGVTWILLSPEAKTNFPCPYRNSVLAVCRLTR